MKAILQKWGLLALTLFTFFCLLGSRSLNEPDEGRYSEIAREMIETGDWLVPHLWYLPHLDKPPMTYWLVAGSMKWLGQNEWAARLPAALAGISGVWAVFLLGGSLGGRRVGFWSAVILQSSLLYFGMARMLTPDIFLAQFTVWAVYFFWRSWLGLKSEIGNRKSEIILWHLAGWTAIALGFLTKGPVALAIPLVGFVALLIFRRKEVAGKKLVFIGLLAGFAWFFILAAPWFLAVFRVVPDSAHFMILGQAAGHLLGTTIKNRPGGPFYFLGILTAGLLPWTFLLGWLWRRAHWRALSDRQKDGWLLLSVWAIFTFTLFSLSQAKLPAYILPIFPALAVLLALRFFSREPEPEPAAAPAFVWRLCLASPLLFLAAFPPVLIFSFRNALPGWMVWQMPVAAGAAILLLLTSKKLKAAQSAGFATGLTLCSLMVILAEVPRFETNLRDNQTLQPVGAAVRENYRPGDALVCWGKFPQGLPFYTGLVISKTNRPYFGGMDLNQAPFEFPGNRERLGDLLLPDANALARLLASDRQVWVVSSGEGAEILRQSHVTVPLRLVLRAGRWELLSNR
jgi:4-amino-4-deoxy-L-arabinose transferase-like glycosyltransferase